MTDRHPANQADAVVLLVEDDALVRMAAAEMLAGAGFDVVPTADASEALAFLGRGGRPDMLVTDVRMPGPVDGLALAGIVAQRFPWIGILVCSAHARPTADELPADAIFLPKPYPPALLLRHLATLVRRRAPASVMDEA